MGPKNESAAFKDLRAYGAFLVSAQVDAKGTITHVKVISEAGAPCTFQTPWPESNLPIVLVNGTHPVKVVAKGSMVYTFNTTKGSWYAIEDGKGPGYTVEHLWHEHATYI